jgi:hypothetical protein
VNNIAIIENTDHLTDRIGVANIGQELVAEAGTF